MFDAISAVLSTAILLDEHKAFNTMCDSLPEDIAKRLREDRRESYKKEIDHNKALEIANAGRARNFWGN